MSRARLNDTVLQEAPYYFKGVDDASVQVNLRSGGAATVYRAETGVATWANPLTTRDGRIEPVETGRRARVAGRGSYDVVVTHELGRVHDDVRGGIGCADCNQLGKRHCCCSKRRWASS